MKKFIILFVLCLAIAGGMIGATRRDLSQPNARIFTEMSDSPAYRSHSPNPVFELGQTLRRPVEGSIPRGFLPSHYAPTPEDRKRAGLELKNTVAPTLEALAEGKRLYQVYCGHCHGRTGKGDGAVARRIPTLSMPINGKATYQLPDGEIFHIILHGRNNMPPHGSQVRPDDRWKIIHYLRQIQRAELDRIQRLGLVYEDQEDPRPTTLVSAEYGAEIYRENCASCHGENASNPLRGVPTLSNARVLGVADDQFYIDSITHGRKGSAMMAWMDVLTPTQIKSVVKFLRSLAPQDVDRSKISLQGGDAVRGRALFRGNCAGCHGRNGEGGIGVSLNRPSFLAVASDTFLRDTITLGRKHTAMPSYAGMKPDEISDILAYIRSWTPVKHTFAKIAPLLPQANAAMGKKIYAARCAACHGGAGEGGIGSRLYSESFLSIADDEFLYRAITEGRPNTAMPAWGFLEAQDVADLIAHLRSWRKGPAKLLSKARRSDGRAEFGEILYQQGCVQCHGPEGRGGVGAQLANQVFLDSASDEFLYQSIAYGKAGTAMRGFLKGKSAGAMMELSPADIDNLIAYLRAQQGKARVEPLMRPQQAVSLVRGKEVYENAGACAKCHGTFGEGGSGPALGNHEFLQVASDGYLTATIVLGRERTPMLPFSRGGNVALSEEDLQDVVAYVRSLADDPTARHRAVERAPSSVAEGRDLWTNHCAGCHGSDGLGPVKSQRIVGYAPSINNREFLQAADDGFLLATIALGRPGTPMRAFAKGAGGVSELPADDLKKIVAFIRSWEPAAEAVKKEDK